MDNPESRNEAILQNMLGENNELLEPQSRIEALLQLLLAKLGGSGGNTEVPVAYFIDEKQKVSFEYNDAEAASNNAYLILTQLGVVYVMVANGSGTAVDLSNYGESVVCTVDEGTVEIDFGSAANIGVIIPILNAEIGSVTFDDGGAEDA